MDRITVSRSLFGCLIAALFAGVVVMNGLAARHFEYPFTSLKLSPLKEYAVLDLGGVMLGARRLAADIAWIQLLQYYGSPEVPLDKETEFQLSWAMTRYLLGVPLTKETCRDTGCHDREHYHPRLEGGTYSLLQAYARRVVGLDPFFHYAYLYGAGSLAWNLKRPDEALDLLKEGIGVMERYRPAITTDIHQPFWQYHLYLSAILYGKSGDFSKMTTLLETAVRQEGCPAMVKVILANIYQKGGDQVKSLQLWIDIARSGDPSYRWKSQEKIAELRKLLLL